MDCIWVFTSVRDEQHLMPFFLRHYGRFADRIFVKDNGSRDRTVEICKADPIVSVSEHPESGMDEQARLTEAYEFISGAHGKAEWCIVVDADEFIIGNYGSAIDEADLCQSHFCLTLGWNMVGNGLPRDDGRQIYEISPMGIAAPVYAKSVVVRAGAKFEWVLGKHKLVSSSGPLVTPQLHLLHYRYMGGVYTAERNNRNYCRSVDKATAWSCSPGYHGEHSADWAEAVRTSGINVMRWIRKNPTRQP